MSNVERIPEHILAEQWYGFVHTLIGKMQAAFRSQNTTQKAIAAKLGKKESFVSRCLSGQQNMTIRTIFMIARAMNCRLEITFRPLADVAPKNDVPQEKPRSSASAGGYYIKSADDARSAAANANNVPVLIPAA